MATKKASVLIVDAEAVARFGLAQLVNSHAAFRCAGEAESVLIAREMALRLQPEVVVFDPALGDASYLIQELLRAKAPSRMVAFTSMEDAASVQRAFRAGVSGYVTRRDPIAAVMDAILAAVEGKRHVGPRVEHILLELLACGSVQMSGDETAALSARERQIYELLGAGKTARIIASDLGVSVKTVETHRQRIKTKLRLSTGAELSRRAFLSAQRSLR